MSLRAVAVSLLSLALLIVNAAGFQLIPNKYVIELKPATDPIQHLTWVNAIHGRNARKRNSSGQAFSGVHSTIQINNFKAYTGEFDDETIRIIRTSPDVHLVERDSVIDIADMYAADEASHFRARALIQQQSAPRALQILSQRPRASQSSYFYDNTAGQGTYAYVLDTGINIAHQEFGNRASYGWTGYPSEPSEDQNGHGTHVAGIIGARTYGVSKLTNLIAVKVFSASGSGSISTLLAGYSWSVNNIKANGYIGKSVINMAVGGTYSQTVNDAVKAAFNDGILTVVAAGGSNTDVSTSSPASAPEALTVSSIDVNYAKANSANYGPGVDVFAVGELVLSTWIGSDTATRTLSGTSMSCAHGTGLALYFQRLNGNMPPQQLRDLIVNVSSKNAITGLPSGTPNNLAYNNSGK